MGAFGRSRMAEAIFGGVTRQLLKESPIPLLITHSRLSGWEFGASELRNFT